MEMNPDWLTPQLRLEVRKVFEPRYKRSLSDDEVISIAQSLTQLMEVFLKFRWRTYGTDNTRP